MMQKKPSFGVGKLFIKQKTGIGGDVVQSPKTFRIECESIYLDISQDHDDMLGDGVFLDSMERKKITISGRLSGVFTKKIIGEMAGVGEALGYSIDLHSESNGIYAGEPACKISSSSTGLDILHDCGVIDASGIRLANSKNPIIGEYYFDDDEKSYHFPIGGLYFPSFLYKDHSRSSENINILDFLQGSAPTFCITYASHYCGEMTTIQLNCVTFPRIGAISAKSGDFSVSFLDFVASIYYPELSAGFFCDFNMLNQHIFNFDKYLLKLNNNFPNGSNVIYDVTNRSSVVNTGQIFTSAYLENGITTINTNSASLTATPAIPPDQYPAGMTIDFWWRPPSSFDVAVFFAWGQYNNAGNCPSLTYSATFQKFFLSDGVVNFIDISRSLSTLSGKFNRITLFFSMNSSGAINSADLYIDKNLIASGSIASPGYVSAGRDMKIMSGLGSAGVGYHAEFSLSKGKGFPY